MSPERPERPARGAPTDWYHRRIAIRRDEVLGFWQGFGLAVGLGAVGGLATIVVLVGWLRLAGISGTFESASAGLLFSVGWWAVFWLALSGGLVASLWTGYRAWQALYPVQQRHHEARQRREAISTAEAILDDARSSGSRRG